MTPRDVSIAADLLLDARRKGVRLTSLPAPANPGSWDDAYAVQDHLVRKLGTRAGWKVGATTPEADRATSYIALDALDAVAVAHLPGSYNVGTTPVPSPRRTTSPWHRTTRWVPWRRL